MLGRSINEKCISQWNTNQIYIHHTNNNKVIVYQFNFYT